MPTTTTGLATSFITFSRPGASGGGATVTDRDGKIKWAGHNLLTNSESFDASSWIKGGNTIVSANAAVAPNGTTTADRISVQFTAGQAQVFNISVTTTAATYTAAAFLKADTASTWAALNLYDAALTNKRVWFNLNTGAKGTEDSGITGTITPLSNGWYFCTVTRAITGATGGLSVEVCNGDNVVTGTAGNAIYAWGAHLYRSDLGGMQQNPAMPAGMQSYYPTTPRNLLGYSEDFSNAYWVKNGSAVSSNVVLAPNGLQTADKITENTASSNHAVYTSTAVLASPYTFSVYLKAAERSWVYLRLGLGAYFNLSTGTKGTVDAGVTADIVSVGDGWYRCWIRVTTSAGTEYPTVFLASANGTNSYTGDGVSGIYLWGAQLSDSASLDTYVPQYGAAVTSAAYYAPRLDFDGATLAAKGLLVEELRTNLALNSNAVGGSSYTLRNTTITANAGVAPDGTSTATKLQETTGSNFFDAYQSMVVTSGASYTSSVYAKAVERNWIWMQTANGNNKTWFNLSTGVVGTNGAGNTATITAVGNGWYRCTVSCAAATTAGYVDVGLSNADNTLTYTGVAGSGVLLWGAQLEAGSFSTSYIPNGSAVAGATRAADVASVSTQAFPYSASEGTLVANGSFISLASTSVAVMASLSNNASSNSINIYRQSAAMQLNTIASGSAGPSYVVAASTDPVKAAFAYKLNDMNAAVNGVAQTTSTTAALPIGVTRLDIGNMWNVDYKGAGWIRQITYIPRRLSNAELAARTA